VLPDQRETWIIQQVEHLAQEQLQGRPKVFDDTTNFMYIDRGHIIVLDDRFFLVRGNEREGRFGLDEQPKFWVKRALCLNTGQKHILKLRCHEAFKVDIGLIQVTCVRSGEKEARVLEFVRGDSRFMQGRSVRDTRGNLVRVIDFIEGMDLLNHIYSLKASHEEYFRAYLPSILARTETAFRAIQFLNENGTCHGDIRNDHILVERETGRFRWIDFDLTQDFSDFDLWSLGNILHCVVGKGFVNFREAIDEHPELSGRLTGDDASVFFPQRVMNLRTVYPYIPEKLNDVLMRFSAGTQTYYDSAGQVADDLCECSCAMGWPVDQG
jgi:hypothetical protein